MVDFLKILVLDIDFAQNIYKNSLLDNFSVHQKNNKNIKWKTNEFNQATIVKEWKGVLFCFFTKKEIKDDAKENELVFTKLEILLKPHYFFNDNLHNANIFTVVDCINTLLEVKDTFNLPVNELKILNIEYGINAVSPINSKDLITYLLYHEKNQFITSNDNLKYSKISLKHDRNGNANNYKMIKFYSKGVHFPQYTNANTFRFEVKSKRTQFIKKLGIKTYADLLNVENYLTLSESIQNEFSKVLIIDADNEMQNLNSKEKTKLNQYLNTITWSRYIQGSQNLFNKHKKIYFKLLDKTQSNIHNLLKNIIDNKLIEILKPCAVLRPNEKEKRCAILNSYIIEDSTHLNQRRCLVTRLDISTQRTDSFLLSENGIKRLYNTDRVSFDFVKNKYLSKKWINASLDTQFSEMYHNIRNSHSNSRIKQKHLYLPNQEKLF